MQKLPLIFDVSDEFRDHDLRGLAGSSWKVQDEPRIQRSISYLDSFDWRLYGASSVLEVSPEQRGYRILWRELGSGQVLLDQITRSIPKKADDASAPGIRQRLEQALGVRALQEKVAVVTEQKALRLLDTENKTVLRLELRRDRILPAHSAKHIDLPARLYVQPYRGYEQVAENILHRLQRSPALKVSALDPMVCAARALDIQPGAYAAQPDYRLRADLPTRDAMQRILRVLLGMLENNREGACEDIDPEFLHDFRRAVTRSRYLLSQPPGGFTSPGLHRVREELHWLDGLTATTRSLDVFIILFEDYKARLPAGQQRYLLPFREFLRDHKRVEQPKVCTALRSPRYQRMVEYWQGCLARQPDPSTLPESAAQPIGGISDELIRSTYGRIVEQGGMITPESGAEELIAVFQTARELGYLVELFRSLYPDSAISKAAKPLHRLLVNLETFRDLEIQQRTLVGFCREMKEEQRLTPASLAAMDQLMNDLAAQEARARAEFGDHFGKFAGSKVAARFADLQASLPLESGVRQA